MTDDSALLSWRDLLAAELGIDPALVDIDAVLGLAGTVAHAVVRPAAPLSTFMAGYAAGLAASNGTDPAEAVAAATGAVRALAQRQS